VRHAQFGESLTCLSGIGVDEPGEQVDDLVVAPEVGKVLERQVDRTAHCAGAAQVAKLVELSLTAGHVPTIDPSADAPLHSG
jgi:hypothetical protein